MRIVLIVVVVVAVVLGSAVMALGPEQEVRVACNENVLETQYARIHKLHTALSARQKVSPGVRRTTVEAAPALRTHTLTHTRTQLQSYQLRFQVEL